MIGLTLVTVVAVLGASLSAGTQSAVKEQLRADYVIDGSGRCRSDAEGGEKAAVPGVTAATHVR